MHVCWPDYVKGSYDLQHPAIQVHRNLENGKTLWNLFSVCGIVPYTCTFKEPSSRTHRQGQAAGCVVFFPPAMGTPSEIIEDGETGFTYPIEYWEEKILTMTDDEFRKVSEGARRLAVSESWQVQAKRFNEMFSRIIDAKHK